MLAVLLVLLAFAAPAGAESTLFAHDARAPLRGPVFAGDRVAWVTSLEGSPGVLIHLARPDGTGHRTWSLPAVPAAGAKTTLHAQLAASPGRLAAAVTAACNNTCRSSRFVVLYRSVVGGPLGEEPTPLGECPQAGSSSVDVSGNVVAMRNSCGGGVQVHDFDSGRVHEFPDGWITRIAGDYLASYEVGPRTDVSDDAIVVREWRTGTERLRITAHSVPQFDIREDGTVVYEFFWSGAHDLKRASPDRPEPTLITKLVYTLIGIAGDRVAVTTRQGVEIRSVEGELIRLTPLRYANGFDGKRLAWNARPCGALGIATWDLAGDPPAMPGGSCPVAGTTSTALTADVRRGRVRVKLVCRPQPALGCRGFTTLRSRDRYGNPVDVARGQFSLVPGEARAVDLTLTKKGLCAARTRALRPVLEISNVQRGDEPFRFKRRRVSLGGIGRALAACK